MARYYDSDDAANPHKWYGPCDGFAPGEECSECWEMRRLSLWFWAEHPAWIWADPKYAIARM